MSKGLAWVSGILVALCIVGLLAFGRSERQAYWARRTLIVHGTQPAAQQQPDRMLIWRIKR
jgi:hypothetical protein